MISLNCLIGISFLAMMNDVIAEPIAVSRSRYTQEVHQVISLSILTLACLLFYFPVLNNQFQSLWDDQWVVMNGYTEAGLGWDNILKIFIEFYHGQYAPINQLYYTVLYSLFG